MTLDRNAVFDRLVAELQRLGLEAQQSPTQAVDYQSFLQRFPAAALSDLSLDTYCVGKGDGASFCWWLERGLEPLLGRYMPGTARGHLLYFTKDGTVYKHRKLSDLPDAEALRYTLKVHAVIAGADPALDLRWVDDDAQIYQRAGVEPRVTMGEGRKLRLLAAYWPDAVLPISSSDHLAHFLRALGCAAVDISPAHQPVARMLKLMAYFEAARELCPGITPQGFMKALYAPALGLAPPRHVEEVLEHFAAVPNLADQLKAAGQTEAFCQLVLALHESDLDWWVTRDGSMHAGRTDDPKVWQTVVALELECSQQGVRVRQNTSDAQNGGDAAARRTWQLLDADGAARMADAASSDVRVPPLTSREACWPDDYDSSDTTLSVLLTHGAIRNGYLKVPKLQALFPPECIAPDEKASPQRKFTLHLPHGESIQTWIQANRNRLRERFNSVFAKAQLQEGDRAVIHKEADDRYRLSFQRQDGTSLLASTVPIGAAPNASTMSKEPPMSEPLNQILFGPPGTGKTYATIDAALKILDKPFWEQNQGDRETLKKRFDALAHAERVRFVTFHQSFSYEDFVEGLRASTDEETKQLRYEVEDGVFKALCDTARALAAPQSLTNVPSISVQGRKVWKMSLGDTQGTDAEVYDECLEGGYILLGYGAQVDFTGATTRQAIADRYKQAGISIDNVQRDYGVTSVMTFVNQMDVGHLIVVTDGNLKFRAIGEIIGNYEFKRHETLEGYSQMRRVRWLRTYSPSLPYTELMKKKFSQMTLYQLQQSAVDADKLQRLLDGASTERGSALPLGPVGNSEYVVTKVTDEVVMLTKPNGNQLPFARAMLEVLAQAVRDGDITIGDIKNKEAVGKLPGKGLEPFLVNGYQNILAPLVQQLISSGAAQEKKVPPDNSRVLIIDEINRGNIARIFGELITLIEPSKRTGADEALEVVLPYSKTRFSVPQNVYLIGTMNTADRSLTGLDVALRRRFVFHEMPPRPDLLDDVTVSGLDGVTMGQMLHSMNQRIEALLDRDHCLGHAYFMPLRKTATLEQLGSIFRNQVLPLLQEYFFDDWQRIQWVLNDHRKAKEHQFVQSSSVDVAALLGPDANVARSPQSWRINVGAFVIAQSYRGIVQSTPAQAIASMVSGVNPSDSNLATPNPA
ncbi:AAA family ATPase [Acidovorax sp.]|uniref:AAA family ATPase n=1 Tax=Acidovorax sp. TaxID=1872122 RepID=UPI002627464A|nr:AAA family ATPase [Acidovorax sp.]